ncbi:MFS transporter [Polyangium mundeleinium]|uniref:MFS transporter n=1 Tax=Polyangium mundeleinium TaxID=2995306 RepID=A0ABT5F4H7_9BACT|nr:MFS transporter [Polyangium mundeleinium]MDC0748978.1 MFS transporter [Polyangium mundeleinium]
MSQGTAASKNEARDGGLSLLFIGFFVFGLLSTIIGVTIPNVKQEFGITNEASGMVFVCWSCGVLVGAYLGGKAFYVASARTLLIVTSLSSIACLLLLYGERELPFYRLYIFALSLSGSVFFTAGHATAAKASRGNKVSTLSFMDFSFSMGSLSTPLLVNRFAPSGAQAIGNWRLVFLVAAALLVVVLVLAARRPEGPRPDPTKAAARVGSDYLSVLRSPIALAFMMGCLFLQATEWGHCVWFVTYAHEAIGLSTEQAREAFSLFLVGMASSRLLMSWLSWIFRSTTLMAILVSIATVAAASVVDHQSYSALCTLNFMFGFGLGALFPLMLGLSMELAPTKSSMLSGIGLMAGTLGAQGLSYSMGLFADHASLAASYRHIVWAVAALLLCMLAFLSLHIRRRGPSKEPADGTGESAAPAMLDSGRLSDARVAFSFHPFKEVFDGLVSRLRARGSRRSLRDHLRRALLDMDLRREFVTLFGKTQRITREEAFRFLHHVQDKYPLVRELYPSPAEMLAVADQNPVPR